MGMELAKSSHFVIDGFYNKTFYDFYQTKYNMHAAFEIMYIASGSSEVRMMMRDETQREQRYLLTKDMFILIGPNQIHQLLTHDKCRIMHIEFVYSGEFNSSLNFLQLLRRNRATAELLSDKFTYAVCRGDYGCWILSRRSIRSVTTTRRRLTVRSRCSTCRFCWPTC